MSFDNEKELLDEYLEWSAQKKSFGTDVTPETFLVDRAKEQALETLIKIKEQTLGLPEDVDDWTNIDALRFAEEVYRLINAL